MERWPHRQEVLKRERTTAYESLPCASANSYKPVCSEKRRENTLHTKTFSLTCPFQTSTYHMTLSSFHLDLNWQFVDILYLKVCIWVSPFFV